MSNSQELEDERKATSRAQAIERWAALPKTATDYWEHQAIWYKSMLFDAWKTMAGQSRGLQRQRRIINRLRAELKAVTSSGPGDSNGV